MIATLAMLTALPACEMETRVVREPWWSKLPADPKPGSGGGGGMRQAGAAWAIPLKRFTGPDRQQAAQTFIRHVQQVTGVRDLWSEDIGGTAVVYRGRFTDPTDEQAHLALQHTRRLRVDGEQPFIEARLSNLRAARDGGPAGPHDISQYPGFYTLQIAYYDSDFGEDFRDAAEQAVRELREDDHEAYYYHGPHRSLITVGLFTYAEAFVTASDPTSPQAQVDAYSPTVRELQKAFPHNLANGITHIDYTTEGERIGERHSFLVRVF